MNEIPKIPKIPDTVAELQSLWEDVVFCLYCGGGTKKSSEKAHLAPVQVRDGFLHGDCYRPWLDVPWDFEEKRRDA